MPVEEQSCTSRSQFLLCSGHVDCLALCRAIKSSTEIVETCRPRPYRVSKKMSNQVIKDY